MSLWSWIFEYLALAREAGDYQRIKLYTIYTQSIPLIASDPDQSLALLTEGEQLAEELHEPWWILFYKHWQMQVLLFYKRDFNRAMDMSVRCAVETRKETYARFPQRICLHEDLVSVYLGTDPMGHIQEITQALDYIQTEVSSDFDCRYCLQSMRVDFSLALHQSEDAAREADIYTQMSQQVGHYLTGAHSAQCRVAYLRQQWDTLLGWAQAGEKLAYRNDRPLWLLEFLAWQAFVLCKMDRPDEALRFFNTARLKEKYINAIPSAAYYNALSAYHETRGDYAQALAVRRRELANLVGNAQTDAEVQCRLYILRLLRQMGLPFGDEVAAARQIAAQLIDPSRYVAELDQLAPNG